MKEEVKLIIGLNDKDTKKQEISTEEAEKVIENVLFQYTDGYTLQLDTKGLYKHENGETVKEASIIILLYYTDNETINKIIKELKQQLNQESIMKIVIPCYVDFV